MRNNLLEKTIDSIFNIIVFMTIMPIVTIKKPETIKHPVKEYNRIMSEYKDSVIQETSIESVSKTQKPHDWDKSPKKIYKIKINQNKRIQRPRTHNIRSQIRK